MPSAGESVIAGRMPGERIATQIDTADSGTFTTTETTVQTVVAALVNGRTYRIKHHTRWGTSVSGDRINSRLREDNSVGNELQSANVIVDVTATGSGFPGDLEVEYTAVATGNKTFVATGDRSTGTGVITCEGAATPRYLYVDYIRG